ncbi:Cysteine-rich receptor-like protein kinase 29 [Euphorbia peplus]|nr:Cysteine-rich receptor-like protein kinase 29 [Euphorbia peplus]
MIGKGGFGSLYEGTSAEGQQIAVKKLNEEDRGKKEFLAEIKSLGAINYNNLVKLLGYCRDNKQTLLVYELMSNGSLDKWIFNTDRQRTLDWEKRRKIILDVAKGLCYLH